jgi:hypothetical protein
MFEERSAFACKRKGNTILFNRREERQERRGGLSSKTEEKLVNSQDAFLLPGWYTIDCSKEKPVL